ncbi:omega-amidase NIT2 isoform X2 [Pectinophora gossypiella]|uniref:omega-amidase NIT2 isoform X2 n=1 Tax=Pectinophora gossypiella TaxID=13191 RepID=UPI00214EE188|nr:omega-amidase NIT2 isoform X2 [Pectinophora gossypiella]
MSNMLKRGLKIALVQMSVCAEKAKNIEAAVCWISKAKDAGAELVALPECFNSPYGTKYFNEYAEEIPSGETSRALSEAAAKHGVCVVGGTMPERRDGKLYNTCTVWDGSGKLLATYRKMHLFDIDIPNKITFKESDSLSPGNQVTTFEYKGVKIGLGICYDLRFPELAHIMAKDGCSLLIYPGAFNMTTGPKHWELLARSRANDQQLWTALVSPARDEQASYVAWGHSMLVGPWANVVQQLDEQAGMLVEDVGLGAVEEVRSQIPIRSQRRTDIYEVVNKCPC